MENEYMKRGYLLPPGCKDLVDALKHKRVFDAFVNALPHLPKAHEMTFDPTLESSKQLASLPPIKGQIVIPPHTTVRKLATLLDQKPFQIIGDLMQLGTFATPDFLLDFKTISKIARMHGFVAIRAM